jgi:AraC-like DNA-binding protein
LGDEVNVAVNIARQPHIYKEYAIEFRDKLFNLIEAQHSDSNFKIELMSDMLGMSRILLYRKITSIFGMSPSDLLRNFRLQKAVQLLTDQRRNVSEVAYTVGFSSPAYFAKCFKSVYNMTPTEYMYRTQK